ncbi:hypothetical protein EBR96_10790, partial [bacterium]|nr:hypothetical protein [bacterium]
MSQSPTKSRLYFTILRLISDTVLIPVTIIAAYILKFKVGWFFQIVLNLQFGRIYQQAQIEPYLDEMGMVMLIWITTFYFMGLYRPFSGIMPEVDEWVKVAKAVAIATIELMAYTFIYKSFPGSRFVIGYACFIGVFLISIGRYMVFRLELRALRNGQLSQTAVVIGENDIGQDIVEKLRLFPTLCMRYIGTICKSEPDKVHFHARNVFKRLGPPAETLDIIRDQNPDVVFLADPDSIPDLNALKSHCETHSIDLRIVSKDLELAVSIAQIEDFDGLPFVHYYRYQPDPTALAIKYTFDWILSLLG